MSYHNHYKGRGGEGGQAQNYLDNTQPLHKHTTHSGGVIDHPNAVPITHITSFFYFLVHSY